MAADAATSLVLLSTPPRSTAVVMPLKKRFKSDEDSLSQETCVPTNVDEEQKLDERISDSTPDHMATFCEAQTVKSRPFMDTHLDDDGYGASNDGTFSTPVKQFKLCGVKRDSDSVLRICYKSDHEEHIEVPMHFQDTKLSFMARRDHMLKQLFDGNRSEVYCSWRGTLVLMLVKDVRWTLYKESLQQKRYLFETIQLVVSRFTCTQWRDGDRCRNCSNRNWRTGCQTPTYLIHLMPLPAYRNNPTVCDASLAKLSPCELEKDVSDWKKRMPQASVR